MSLVAVGTEVTMNPDCMICQMLAEQEGSGPKPGPGSVDILTAFQDVWTDPERAKAFLAAVREHMAHSGTDAGAGAAES